MLPSLKIPKHVERAERFHKLFIAITLTENRIRKHKIFFEVQVVSKLEGCTLYGLFLLVAS